METFWKQIKTSLKKQLPAHSYRMWIEPLVFAGSEEDHLMLLCPNCFFKKRILDHFGDTITTEMEKRLGKRCKLDIQVVSRNKKAPTPPPRDGRWGFPT